MKLAAQLLALSVLCFSAHTALGASADNRTIENMRVSQTGKVTVAISGATVNPNNCAQANLVFESSEPSYKIWIAQLLTAQAAGMQVTFSIVDNECAGTNPKIQNIRLLAGS